MVALSDPMGPPDATPDLIRRLVQEAARTGRLPCLYKTGARTAVQARRMGWQTHPVAVEAWLTPATFDLATPARAGLRRKLRRAEKHGLRIERGGVGHATVLPMVQMTQIADRWAQARGGERGFSMGRFAPDYVAGQQVWLAYVGDRLCAFATFNATHMEWTLDLMRQDDDAPDGIMHALIAAALRAARDEAVPRLSLAALPPDRAAADGPLARLLIRADAASGVQGLRQFKAAFDPQREILYIAAPTRTALAVAAIDIARAIRFPTPLPGTPRAEPATEHAISRRRATQASSSS